MSTPENSAQGAVRHFLDVDQLDSTNLRGIMEESKTRKAGRIGWGMAEKDSDAPLAGKMLAMIFERPSTRTRVSFEVAMRQLGGEAIFLADSEIQLGKRETVPDMARVLSRYVDAIMIRAKDHATVLELAEHATVPVINGLTDRSHPCQLMADVMTLEEHCGPAKDMVVTWTGDGNNVAASWIHGAARFGYEMRLSCPVELRPEAELVEWARGQGANIKLIDDPMEAASGANCVVADVWVSMNDEEAENRHNLLQPYQVNDAIMAQAADNAVFMHCLPAHRGEEVTASVIDGPQSVVFDEAENRLHAQKGILTWCLGGNY